MTQTIMNMDLMTSDDCILVYYYITVNIN